MADVSRAYPTFGTISTHFAAQVNDRSTMEKLLNQYQQSINATDKNKCRRMYFSI
jgi:hypothetical protein